MVARRRVVVTGMGAVTPIGITIGDVWTNAILGRSGARSLSDVPHYLPHFAKNKADIERAIPCKVACPVLVGMDGNSSNNNINGNNIKSSNANVHNGGSSGMVESSEATDIFTPSSRESRAEKFTLHAVAQALQDAGFRLRAKGGDSSSNANSVEGLTSDSNDQSCAAMQGIGCPPERVGVNIGIGMSGLHDVSEAAVNLYGDEKASHYKKIGPYFVPKILANTIAGTVAQRYCFRGPNKSTSSACATGAHCIGDGFRWIQYGEADVAICGAAEACISPVSFAGFCRMKALSTRFNDNPKAASRPFDKQRCGFVMGEGAGILVLEEYERAIARGATIYGEIVGYGMSCDAYHVSAPHPQGLGASLCIKNALDDASRTPSKVAAEHVTYVNAHATGTPMGDEIELAAITNTLVKCDAHTHMARKERPLIISSSKGYLGHLLGAAGSVEAAISLLAVRHNKAPPNVNLASPVAFDAECIKLNTEPESLENGASSDESVVLCTSFGFGGANCALLFKRCPSAASASSGSASAATSAAPK